jgi:hypothetical protein
MTKRPVRFTHLLAMLVFMLIPSLTSNTASAQNDLSANSKEVYEKIKGFALTGGLAEVKGLVLQRDRVQLTFDGTFQFAAPVEGRIAGAVFTGLGQFRAEVPPSEFEKENVKRLLGVDVIGSDFKTAVLRFTDDSLETIGQNRREGAPADPQAQKLALESDARILKETGANLKRPSFHLDS